MTQIAVTGASGFIGQQLLPALTDHGHHVKALSRTEPTFPPAAAVDHLQGRLEDRPSIEALIAGCEVVIHLAGATAAETRADYFKANAAGTTQLVAAMRAKAPRARLIHVSSLAARAASLSDYSASKWAGETVVRTSGLDWTILRPPAVYGANDRAMRPLWQSLRRGWVPCFGSAEARFSLLHVADLVAALVLLSEPGVFASANGRCIELDDGFAEGISSETNGQSLRGYGWPDLVQLSQSLRNRPARLVQVPGAFLAVGAHLSALNGRLRGQAAVFNPDKLAELKHNDWVCRPHDPAWLPGWSPRRRLGDTLCDDINGAR